MQIQHRIMKQKYCIDSSTSMRDQQSAIISGFNEDLDKMRTEEKELGVRYLVTLVTFDDTARIVYKDKPLAEVPYLTKETYKPSGNTALYDGVGLCAESAAPGETDNNIVIMTDGQENNSTRWTKTGIKTLLTIRQQENKWGVTFFGANQDAWTEASALGVMNALNYSDDRTDGVMKSMSVCRSAYVQTAMRNEYDVSSLSSKIKESDLR